MAIARTGRRSLLGPAVAALTLALAGCITVNVPDPQPPAPTAPTSPTEAPASPSPSTSTSTAAPVSTTDLARATVKIIRYDDEGRPTCSGSGSILDAEGTILTNFHVIEPGEVCKNDTIGVALTESVDAPAEAAFIARAYAVDPDLDLAVIKIETDRDGEAIPKDFPYVQIGDSDQVQIGDQLRILGYPGIGGDTITYTEGQVSGFTPAPDIEGRAWVKTQATIAGGNSGGLATDAAGRLVGVPTRAGGGAPGDRITDCRVVQDTDNDNDTDGDDKCVPIGGFLNSLRPVNLARDLITKAATADPLANDALRPAEESTSSAAAITAIRFAGNPPDPKTPEDAAVSLPSSTDRVCAFFDYGGIEEGTQVDLIWKFDGKVDETASLYGYEWTLPVSGISTYCSESGDGRPAAAGLWELSIYLNGDEEATKTRSVFVGDDHPVGAVTFRNDTTTPLCELLVAPHLATQWQNDRLGAVDPLPPGGSVTFDLAAGSYDVLGRDCDDQDVVELLEFDAKTGTSVALTT